jgi:hypothetical protein
MKPNVVLTMNTLRKTASMTDIPSSVAAPTYPSRTLARSYADSPAGNTGLSVAASICNPDCTKPTPSATATTAPAYSCHLVLSAPTDNLSMHPANSPRLEQALASAPDLR